MEENKNKSYWQPAIEIFTQVSTWIVIPIVLALVFGKMLDARYGTRPVIFLILAGAGFLFSCMGIIRIIKNYIKKLQSITKQNNNFKDQDQKN